MEFHRCVALVDNLENVVSEAIVKFPGVKCNFVVAGVGEIHKQRNFQESCLPFRHTPALRFFRENVSSVVSISLVFEIEALFTNTKLVQIGISSWVWNTWNGHNLFLYNNPYFKGPYCCACLTLVNQIISLRSARYGDQFMAIAKIHTLWTSLVLVNNPSINNITRTKSRQWCEYTRRTTQISDLWCFLNDLTFPHLATRKHYDWLIWFL